MKKTICFIISLLLIFSFYNAKAYNTDTYKIDIPSEFKKEKDKDIFKKETKEDTIILKIEVHNNESKLNFEDYDNLKKESYLKELEKRYKETQKDIEIKSSNIEFVNVNKIKAIKMDITSSYITSDKYNSMVYQTQYIIASKNYIYYIVISTSNKEILNSKDINNIVNSFTIKDDLAKKDESLTKYYLSIAIICASGVLGFVLYNRRK